jgi:signal transduction histidine kinase
MSDAQTNPLKAARDLVGDLLSQADGAIRHSLDELYRLLADAQRRGEGDDADALRVRIGDLVDMNAQFVSVMVHEIRIPMTSIKGYSDMLAKSLSDELPLDDATKAQFVETIRSNVTRMEHLVTDISDISKLRAGRMRLDNKMDTHKNIAMRVEKDMASLADAQEHTLSFDTPDGLPLLNLDSARLIQVIEKLLANAIQYTPKGGEIVVRAENVNGNLRVSVIDNGIGMTAEEQSHIGELFWRADHELVRSFKGHGLGLSIAIGFIQQLGGQFFFESEPDKGSVFGFIVPGMS